MPELLVRLQRLREDVPPSTTRRRTRNIDEYNNVPCPPSTSARASENSHRQQRRVHFEDDTPSPASVPTTTNETPQQQTSNPVGDSTTSAGASSSFSAQTTHRSVEQNSPCPQSPSKNPLPVPDTEDADEPNRGSDFFAPLNSGLNVPTTPPPPQQTATAPRPAPSPRLSFSSARHRQGGTSARHYFSDMGPDSSKRPRPDIAAISSVILSHIGVP